MGIWRRDVVLRAGHFPRLPGLTHNFLVMARALPNGDFTFCPICDFNDLDVAETAHIATSGLYAWYQAFDGIDQPDF
jgi:hypothetical protein